MPTLIVIGDVHGRWDEADERFLESGDQDAALFVGDFGDEDIALVERIARLGCEKYVILGNHDAWSSMSGRDLSRVKRQLDSLGESNLGYHGKLIAGGRLGLVGGRPFTWGGAWGRYAVFYRTLFGLSSEEDSAAAIVGEAAELGDVPLLFVGHNGPTGLGASRDSIFGADFTLPSHDHGDGDLRMAMDEMRGRGRAVLGTVAGHMHDRLLFGGRRQRLVIRDGLMHVNVAVVPRHRRSRSGVLRHFTRFVIDGDSVISIDDVHVDDHGTIVESEPLFESNPRSADT